MLQSIRDRTQGWFAGTIIFILIFTFALWGIHSYFVGGAGANDTVAKVNGVNITRNEFNATYERMRQLLLRQSNPADFNQQVEQSLKSQALLSLINFEVLKQAAEKQHFVISADQLDRFLTNVPDFQDKGQFSVAKLNQFLTNNLLNPQGFLNLIKTTLTIDQPRLGMLLSSFSLPKETENTIALIQQERNISYALLPLSIVSNSLPPISDETIKQYYQQHQDEFKIPEQLNVQYISYSLKDLLQTIHPTDEQIKNYYTENTGNYSEKGNPKPFEAVKAQVKSDLITQQAQEKFAEVKEKISDLAYTNPESLKALSNEYHLPIQTSEFFTKQNGGKDISANSMIREAAFSDDVLNKKFNSNALSISSDQIVVLRLNELQPEGVKPLASVKNSISDRIKARQLDQYAFDTAKQLVEELKKNNTQLFNKYQLSWKDTGYVGRHSKNIDPAILESAFATQQEPQNHKIFQIVKVKNGYAVIAVKSVKNGALDKNDKEKFTAFADQIQNAEGLVEYELYKQSQMNRAKIVNTAENSA